MIGSEELRKRKEQIGMSYDELAEKSGIPKTTCTYVVLGRTAHPRVDTFNAIAVALGFPPEESQSSVPPRTPVSDAEERLLAAYNSLIPPMQKYLLEMAERLAEQSAVTKNKRKNA